MDDADRYKLLCGPYVAPKCKRGDILTCEARGRDVRVGQMSDGLIQWPCALKTGRRSLIVCGDLARAVRTESEIAICHHWGVNVVTVWSWRKALGVPQINDGTARLYHEYSPEKLTEDVSARGREIAKSAESRAKVSATKTGVPVPPQTRAALLEACKAPKSEDWKQKHRAALIARGTRPRNPNRPDWNPEEDALLGTDFDRAVAEKLGRSIPGVRGRRKILGIESFKP